MDKEKTMEEKNPDTDRKQEQLTWLENLQRNSWEPEVIISGITLAFLFAFPSKIYTFSAMLVQELGLHFLGAMLVLLYLSAVISVFKIFFVVHLVLRFIWAGLLGLSYAFPEGVIKENLFKISRDYEYQKPSEMVLAMERICSMTFAYPISLVFMILIFTSYLGFLLIIYVSLDISFFIIYIIFMISVLGFMLLMVFNKKSKLKKKYANSIISSVGAIYQSNLGKWFSIFYGLGIFLFSTPLIYNDVRDFSLFFNETNLLENELRWPTKELSYSEFHQEERRYPRVFLPNEIVDNEFLRLSIARYQGDDKFVKDLSENFRNELDSLGWHELKDTPDLYRFSVGKEVLKAGTWRRNRIQGTDQKVYETTIPIDQLPPGTYTLKVEKLIVVYNLFSNAPEKIRLREQWDEIDFIKQ
jgi:hypothetical protein